MYHWSVRIVTGQYSLHLVDIFQLRFNTYVVIFHLHLYDRLKVLPFLKFPQLETLNMFSVVEHHHRYHYSSSPQ